jgi:hypothetical protein
MPRRHFSRGERSHQEKSLRLRGDVVHTFGTLLTPTAIGLVVLGFYLLGSAVAQPLTANSGSVLAASLILALGFVMLSYLLRNAMAARHQVDVERVRVPRRRRDAHGPARTVVVAQEPVSSLPFQRGYIDSARIRR